jgi:periplasmic protein TonB
METKKNPGLDLEKRRGFFFNFSLMLSVAMVLLAFEWKQARGNENHLTIGENANWDEVPIDIPITIQDPPPPKIIAPIIKPIEDDVLVDKLPEVVFQPEAEDIPEPTILEVPPITEIAEEVVDFSEVMPEPVGGMSTWNDYLSKNLKYPSTARRIGIEGTVYVSFVVEKSGEITDVQLLRGIGGGCDEEAIRVIENAPIWKPGYQRGRPVKVRMRVPIRFKLQ